MTPRGDSTAPRVAGGAGGSGSPKAPQAGATRAGQQFLVAHHTLRGLGLMSQ